MTPALPPRRAGFLERSLAAAVARAGICSRVAPIEDRHSSCHGARHVRVKQEAPSGTAGAGFDPGTSVITQGDSEYYRTLRETAESLVLTRCSLSRTLPIVPDPYRLRPTDSGG